VIFLFCAGLLKDSGCPSNTYRVYKTSDSYDLTSKGNVKFIDWSNFYESFKFVLRYNFFNN